MAIPVADKVNAPRLPFAQPKIGQSDKVLFSFEAIERNEYFNLDGTCVNWSSDLFDVLQIVSSIPVCDIYAGKYTGKQSPLRIHQHKHMKKPWIEPKSVSIEDMWQIRIGKSKGGIHGVLTDNVFYIIWFDPQHNLYPDENYGGIKKIMPPSTCCKERDSEITKLKDEINRLNEELNAANQLFDEYARR